MEQKDDIERRSLLKALGSLVGAALLALVNVAIFFWSCMGVVDSIGVRSWLKASAYFIVAVLTFPGVALWSLLNGGRK